MTAKDLLIQENKENSNIKFITSEIGNSGLPIICLWSNKPEYIGTWEVNSKTKGRKSLIKTIDEDDIDFGHNDCSKCIISIDDIQPIKQLPKMKTTKFYALNEDLAKVTGRTGKSSQIVNDNIDDFDEVIIVKPVHGEEYFIALCTNFDRDICSLEQVIKGNEDYEVFNQQQKTEKSNSLYRLHDNVFDINYGWGVVNKINNGDFPISVRYERESQSYTNDGRRLITSTFKPSLSFTEYSLENGGFSQKRIPPKPKLLDMCFFWDSPEDLENKRILFGILTEMEVVSLGVIRHKCGNGVGTVHLYCSTENPLDYEE